jgi:hypothetical protein
MTTYGTADTDYADGDDSLDIIPANADELGIDAAPAAAFGTTGDSLLDGLLGLAKTKIENIVYFPAKFRPGYVLGFNAIIGEPAMKRYRKGAQGAKKKAEDADMSVGNAMALLDTNVGIYLVVDGERQQIVGTDGTPLLLNSDEFQTTFGPRQLAHVAVRKFLGDADTNTIGGAVLKAAGWGEDLEPLDPTDA